MKLIEHDDTFCESKFHNQKEGHFGGSIIYCCKSSAENENGELWAGNGILDSQVNYCPYCGFRAKVQMKEINR